RVRRGGLMDGTDLLILAVIVVLFTFSILLAAAEMAFARMNRIRALALEDEGRRGAARLAAMLEHPERTINSLLFLVLLSQLTTASLLGILLERQFGGLGVAVGLVVEIVV